MHLEYKIMLPDHDFPIGEKHKLIPSVYPACFKKYGEVKMFLQSFPSGVENIIKVAQKLIPMILKEFFN